MTEPLLFALTDYKVYVYVLHIAIKLFCCNLHAGALLRICLHAV
jgi:hypothetical protein